MTTSRRPLMAGIRTRSSFNHRAGGCCLVTFTFLVAAILGGTIISNYPVHNDSPGGEDETESVVEAAQAGLLELERKAAELTGFSAEGTHWPWGTRRDNGTGKEDVAAASDHSEQGAESTRARKREGQVAGGADPILAGLPVEGRGPEVNAADLQKLRGNVVSRPRGVVSGEGRLPPRGKPQSALPGQRNDNVGSGKDQGKSSGLPGRSRGVWQSNVQNGDGMTHSGSMSQNASDEVPSIEALTAQPAAAEESCVCLEVYSPVCGSNGQTYSNACHARCAKVSFAAGACSSTPANASTTEPAEIRRPGGVLGSLFWSTDTSTKAPTRATSRVGGLVLRRGANRNQNTTRASPLAAVANETSYLFSVGFYSEDNSTSLSEAKNSTGVTSSTDLLQGVSSPAGNGSSSLVLALSRHLPNATLVRDVTDIFNVTGVDVEQQSSNRSSLSSACKTPSCMLMSAVAEQYSSARNGSVMIVSPEACALVGHWLQIEPGGSVLGLVPQLHNSSKLPLPSECSSLPVEAKPPSHLSNLTGGPYDLIVVTKTLEALTPAQLNDTLSALASSCRGLLLIAVGGSEGSRGEPSFVRNEAWWLERSALVGMVPTETDFLGIARNKFSESGGMVFVLNAARAKKESTMLSVEGVAEERGKGFLHGRGVS